LILPPYTQSLLLKRMAKLLEMPIPIGIEAKDITVVSAQWNNITQKANYEQYIHEQ
jgi:hypothetical protein